MKIWKKHQGQIKYEDRMGIKSLNGILPRKYAEECGRTGLIVKSNMERILRTNNGDIRLPAYFPVTTFDYQKFPVDRILQPYLKRMVDGIMVSHYYSKGIKKKFMLPTFIDSGGFASLFQGTKIINNDEYYSLRINENETLEPKGILEQQMKYADIAATLDFIITEKMAIEEKEERQKMTIKNAIYTYHIWEREKEPKPLLYASVQTWDRESARGIMKELEMYEFSGFALGGMVPRISNPKSIIEIVKGIRDIQKTKPLHVFGVGKPEIVKMLFESGVDSVDSSSYIQSSVKNEKEGTDNKGMINNFIPILEELERTLKQLDISANPITRN